MPESNPHQTAEQNAPDNPSHLVPSGTPEPLDPRVNMAARRTGMASFRTQLSLDRTTLAWIRTTLSISGFGFGMVGFFRTMQQVYPGPESERLHAGAIRFGVALIVLGIAATMLTGLSHWFILRRLERGETPNLPRWPLSITVAFLLCILGLAGLWMLLEE
jgi:putative membrane protein